MPLFNNYEPYAIPETGPISREDLKKKFPEFYDEGKSIKVVALQNRFRTVKRVTDKDKIPNGTVRAAPQPTGHKAVRNIMIEGKQVNLQYASMMPDVGAISKSFPMSANRINLKDGEPIRSGEEDKLFFMYYGMGIFANGHTPGRKPLYEFNRPEEKASAEIAAWKKKQEEGFEQLIYSQLTGAQVKKAMKGLNIEEKKTEDLNRRSLRDAVSAAKASGKDLFVQTFYELIASKGDDAVKTSVSEIVQGLRDEEKIKEDEGKFYSKSKVAIGEWNKTPIWDSKQTDSDEAWFAFIKHLETNDVLLEKISK